MKRYLLAAAFALFLSSAMALGQVPAGEGWTSYSVADGVSYYSFSGIEPVSGSAQKINVIDWDMANKNYALRQVWYDEKCTTSTIFRRENAVAAMNAAYEPESIVVKTGGTYHTCMPRDTVMKTPVWNWKNDGAIYSDATGQNICIAYA